MGEFCRNFVPNAVRFSDGRRGSDFWIWPTVLQFRDEPTNSIRPSKHPEGLLLLQLR